MGVRWQAPHRRWAAISMGSLALLALGPAAWSQAREGQQRGGAQVRVGATPNVKITPGEPAEIQFENQAKTVTWGWVRMNDPEGVNALIRQGGRGGMTMGLVPPYLQARLANARTRVVSTRAGNLRRTNGEAPMVKKDMVQQAAKWGELFKVVEKVNSSLDFGDVVVDPKGVSMKYFRGVAPSSGKLIVSGKPSGNFRASIVRTYTGNVVNGAPEVAYYKLVPEGQSLSVDVKEGQEYSVTVGMFPKAVGAQNGTLSIFDGSDITLNVSGNVVAKNGYISAWWEEEPFDFIAGKNYVRKLHVALDGNANTTISMSQIAGVSGVNLSLSSKNAGAKSETVFDIPIKVATNAPDNWSAPLKIRLSAFDGHSTVDLPADVRVQTLWAVWQDYTQSAGKVSVKGTFKFNSSGWWQWHYEANTSSKVTSDGVQLGVVLKYAPQGNQHPGAHSLFTLYPPYQWDLDGYKWGTEEGTYAPLKDYFDQFAAGGIQVKLTVNKASAMDGWKSQWGWFELPGGYVDGNL